MLKPFFLFTTMMRKLNQNLRNGELRQVSIGIFRDLCLEIVLEIPRVEC
jgi:hypothetical protein